MSSLSDRHVVITGGTGALGSAVTQMLVERGAICHVPVFTSAELDRFSLRDHARVTTQEGADLTKEDWVVDYYGSLPGLWASVHIAGGFAMEPLVSTSAEQLRRLMELNLTTSFLSTREAAKRMQASGQGGRIVNVSARPALVPSAGMLAYAVSKSAVAALTQAAAEELRGDGIFVNAVAPSVIDTPRNREAMPEADHASWPRAEEIARTIAFLASPENALTSGAVLPVFGRA